MKRHAGIRKNVVFTPGAAERLEYIRKKGEFSSDADVIREAIRLYQKLMDAQMIDDAEIVIKRQKGGTIETLPELYDKFVNSYSSGNPTRMNQTDLAPEPILMAGAG